MKYYFMNDPELWTYEKRSNWWHQMLFSVRYTQLLSFFKLLIHQNNHRIYCATKSEQTLVLFKCKIVNISAILSECSNFVLLKGWMKFKEKMNFNYKFETHFKFSFSTSYEKNCHTKIKKRYLLESTDLIWPQMIFIIYLINTREKLRAFL